MIQTVNNMLKTYRANKNVKNPQKLTFEDVEGYDVYNPSAPFEYNGKTLICGRVEKRDSEDSKAVFFYEKSPNYFAPTNLPVYDLQDPTVSVVNGYYVFGGTEVVKNGEETSWHTALFYGKTLETLKPLVNAPSGMKDLRIVECADGRIGVLTRPQGEKGGRGKIGFTVVDSFEQLTTQAIDEAPLLNQVTETEWNGANDAFLLEDGRIGVLGHIASFSQGEVRHYYPMTFTIDVNTLETTPMKIIAERNDFLEGPAKREDLKDVLFSGGLVFNDEFAILYVGVSDCEIQSLEIPNPFK